MGRVHGHNYQRFLYELFPENIKTEFRKDRPHCSRQSSFSNKNVTWIDHRVDNNEWREMFAEVSASDTVKSLGHPPGLDDDADWKEPESSATAELDAEVINQLSVWEKAKLAWQLGIAEVENAGLNVTNNVTNNVPTLNVPMPTLTLRLPALSSDESTDSESSDSGSDCEDAITEEQLSHIVIAFYQKINPEKLVNVERIVQRYHGKEGSLYSQWKTKYGIVVREAAWFQHILDR